ncbi:scale keratin-like [Serinus canaria]|uniref:scale keratin-like n=1 Tax=Serinus canaria TaxID=9135 RepID=UPI0021CC75A9|nr:scale keratin-like [Serinus canaria]
MTGEQPRAEPETKGLVLEQGAVSRSSGTLTLYPEEEKVARDVLDWTKHSPGHLLLLRKKEHPQIPLQDVLLRPVPPQNQHGAVPPRTSVAVPQPIAESCNELCARQCPDSSAFIQPPPVVVTFPGPILSSFPQQAVVGSSGAPAFGGSLGLGGLYGAGATQASGGLCTFGRAYAAPACSPCALPRYSKKLWDTCGPC